MSDELKPVRCGCGGEAVIYVTHWWGKCYVCECEECGTASRPCNTEVEAIQAWNKAMGWRKAKVVEHEMIITDSDGCSYHRTKYICGNCKKKVLGGDEYCSHCGCRLILDEDIPMEYFESGGR